MQLRLLILEIGLGRLHLQLCVEQLLLHLGRRQVHQDSVGLDHCAGQHADVDHGGVGQGRDQLDRILAGLQGAGRAAHLANHVAVFDGVGPDGGGVHGGRRRLEPGNGESQTGQNNHSNADPYVHLALLLQLNIRAGDIHCAPYLALAVPKSARPLMTEMEGVITSKDQMLQDLH